MYVIGIDAGGTKTSAISYSKNEEKSHTVVTGPGNVTVNYQSAMFEITKAIEEIIAFEGELPQGIAVGIAGISERLKEEVNKEIAEKYPVEIVIDSDYALAYKSVFQENGILIVAGTGVVLLGKYNDHSVKLGGWGHLLGDEGSGYEIVIRSIKKAITLFEVNDSVPYAIDKLIHEIGCEDFIGLKQYVYSHEKSEIAKYAPVIINEAKNNDAFAQSIIDETVGFFISHIKLLIKKLNVKDEIPLATMGGILSETSLVREKLFEKIKKDNLPIRHKTLTEPNRGALNYFKDIFTKEEKYAVGLMSGTSLDGVDAALCKISGMNNQTNIELVDFQSYPIPDDVLVDIQSIIIGETIHVSLLSKLNVKLGELFSEAVIDICNKNDIDSKTLEFVASHGQTIFHEANKEADIRSTLQIGEPSVIALRTKAKVISNFRAKDIAAGGEGAPLIPKTECILYQDYKDSIFLNIGGISNITYIPSNPNQPVIGYDTGPGNMMIDEAMQYFFDKKYDKDGAVGQSGKVIPELIQELMSHWFIIAVPPKSTGRDEFGQQYTLDLINRYSSDLPEDIVHTLTLFTAKSIAKHVLEIHDVETPVQQVIVGGGGAFNKTLVTMLLNELLSENIQVLRQEDIGFSSDAKEAIGFVVLGNQTLHHQTGNVPSVTGASQEVICGSITWPN